MGYPVYVVGAPGRGRAGFNAAPINEAKSANDAKLIPANILMVTGELAWTVFLSLLKSIFGLGICLPVRIATGDYLFAE
jgi:hypothetical protein